MFGHGLDWHQKMPKKSSFQQLQTWYKCYMQVFQKAKFLGDLTIIKMKKNSDKSISSLLIDCQIVTSAKKISNYFNTFFTSVAVKTNKNIVKSKKHTCPLPWPWKQQHNFPFSNSTRRYWRPNKFNENRQSKWYK